jgi:hypothetical protein
MEEPPAVCPSCRALLEPPLPLCTACGRLFPERADIARTVVVRHVAGDVTGIVRLLAGTCGLREPALASTLARGHAVFRLPGSSLVAAALAEELAGAGAVVEVHEAAPPDTTWQTSWRPWARWLADEPGRLAMLGGAAAAAALVGRGLFAVLITGGLVALDWWRFQRRIVLSPSLLARRLGLLPEGLARAAAAVLRRSRSLALREAIAGLMVEQARLLATVSRGLRAHPRLQGPFRETLDALGEQSLRVAENAATVEQASDADPEDLPRRLADLRTCAGDEIDRQLRLLLTARQDGQLQREWLRRAHGLLVVRLETIAARLRGLRYQAARLLVAHSQPDPEGLLANVRHELETTLTAIAEVERGLPQSLPEVVAEVVSGRGPRPSA